MKQNELIEIVYKLAEYYTLEETKESIAIIENAPTELLYAKIEDVTGITKEEIQSDVRRKEIVFARQLFCYFYIERKIGNFKRCGAEINRNHCTVTFSRNVIKNMIEYDNGWRIEQFNELKNEL
jgi:chromosomal replication initiation ATPase DnaA